MNAKEYDCIQCEILLLILVPHLHPFILEFCDIFHEWFLEHINIDVSFLRTLDKNRQHKVLSFVTQPCRKVIHRRMTGHVLCTILFSPNGFIPFILKANLIFLLSDPNGFY
jgi:hypothetical protein